MDEQQNNDAANSADNEEMASTPPGTRWGFVNWHLMSLETAGILCDERVEMAVATFESIWKLPDPVFRLLEQLYKPIQSLRAEHRLVFPWPGEQVQSAPAFPPFGGNRRPHVSIQFEVHPLMLLSRQIADSIMLEELKKNFIKKNFKNLVEIHDFHHKFTQISIFLHSKFKKFVLGYVLVLPKHRWTARDSTYGLRKIKKIKKNKKNKNLSKKNYFRVADVDF